MMRARLVNLYRRWFPHPVATARRERRRAAVQADQSAQSTWRAMRDAKTEQLRAEIERRALAKDGH